MSVTTQHSAPPKASGSSGAGPTNTTRARIQARRRTNGARLGALPVSNLVVMELGIAAGLVMVGIDRTLWPVAAGVAGVAVIIALLRRRGRWFTQMFGLVLGYKFRNHTSVVHPVTPGLTEGGDENGDGVIGPEENHRVSLLRLVVPDLVVAHGQDHDRNHVGMAFNDGKWTAVLMVEPTPSLVTEIGKAPNLPLGSLTPCLEDRGVVLDAIQVIWHCYPGSAALPSNSPALNSYLEVLGPLPAAARRTTWVTVRLDPKRCAKAVGERGGGIVGAHRALIGALSRVRSALERESVPTRPLDPDELLQAGIASAELQSVLGSERSVGLKERWDGVTAGGVGHSSYAITGWPSQLSNNINALTGVRALSSTVALSISPTGENDEVGLRSLVRVSARTPDELDTADERLRTLSNRLGVTLTPLRGVQLAGFTATLPLGGAI
ncbi:type VII secretion protein EccE [Actinopolyspora erythraea]|uniref:Type VII secretion protein EccE n=1 Tax=Actinopolyspora erythraea TaxID=414996 RepID=A0A223RWB1_9ACTN|nr:type VII secretion protein EccE [Actinopolyspora erythraea]ASU80137.1 type VII secretion protein EccE [Actinopolyspora erythraea]